MSFLNYIIVALSAILHSTSPAPIGLSLGFLSSGISMQASNDSKNDGDSGSFTHNVLISWVNFLRKSNVAVSKVREILRQPSASRPDGLDPTFVNIEVFIITYSSMSS